MYKLYSKLFTLILIVTFWGLLNGCAIEPKKNVPKRYKMGQTNFHRVCAQCHGADAMGGKRAPTFLRSAYERPDHTFAISRYLRSYFVCFSDI